MTMRLDYTGMKFFHLTCIEPTDRKYNTRVLWKMECDCAAKRVVITAPVYVKNGNPKSCGCTGLPGQWALSSAKDRYMDYKSDDKKRGQLTEDFIPFDTFYRMSQQVCHYCGAEPIQEYNAPASDTFKEGQKGFIYNGIDRMDRSAGHIYGNVVPCCYPCNLMKMKLGYNDFIERIEKIAAYQKSKREKTGKTDQLSFAANPSPLAVSSVLLPFA